VNSELVVKAICVGQFNAFVAYSEAMQCNIDKRGRRARAIWGIVMLLVAVAVAVCGATGVVIGWWVWVIAAVLVVAGLFGLYEARKGWCMMRAMGFRTPM
jgi:hypothetical protein